MRLIIYLIKQSNLMCMSNLLHVAKRIGVVEFFYVTTNLS
jgi:hypothetical protein